MEIGYRLIIKLKNGDFIDVNTDVDTINDLQKLYDYSKIKDTIYVAFFINDIEINVKDIDYFRWSSIF
jgi:hypothetical protein